MIVRELTTRLGFQADDAQARRYSDAIRSVRRAAIAATAAVTALAGGTLALSRSLARQGDEIAKAAVEAGLAEDQFQRLTFAIGQVSRVSERQAEQALLRLNDTIGRARIEGGRYAESLERLGFSQAEIAAGAIDNEEAFRRIVAELGNTENAADAAALASRVLGERVGRQLGPALRESGDDFRRAAQEVSELGGGFSRLATDSAQELNDSFQRVGIIARSLRSEIAEQLLPVVNDLVTELTDWFRANREIILQNFRRVVTGVISVMRTLIGIVRRVASVVNDAAAALGGWERVLRLAGIAAGVLIGKNLARWAIRVGGALFGATLAARGFRRALFRIPGVGLFFLLVAAIEDLIVWIRRGDSALGEWLGTWDDFKNKANEVTQSISDWIESRVVDRLETGINSLRAFLGLADLDFDEVRKRQREQVRMGVGLPGAGAREARRQRDAAPSIMQRLRDMGLGPQNFGAQQIVPRVSPAPGLGFQRNINVRTDVTLQIPAGTTEQQQTAVTQQAQAVFAQEWDRLIRQSMADFQPQE